MKLQDLDKSLTEAPAGMWQRAKTKMKKHTPFNAGARAEAEGRDVLEIAANQLNLALRTWIGKSGKDINSLSHRELVKFFASENFGKSAQTIIAAHPKVAEVDRAGVDADAATADKNAKDADTDADKAETTHKKPANMSDAQFAKTKKAYGFESLEARLENMLIEASVDMVDPNSPNVFFDKNEVEEIIMQVVSLAHEENGPAVEKLVKTKASKDGSETSAGSIAPKDDPKDEISFKGAQDLGNKALDDIWKQMERNLQKSGVDKENTQAVKDLFVDAAQKTLADLGS